MRRRRRLYRNKTLPASRLCELSRLAGLREVPELVSKKIWQIIIIAAVVVFSKTMETLDRLTYEVYTSGPTLNTVVDLLDNESYWVCPSNGANFPMTTAPDGWLVFEVEGPCWVSVTRADMVAPGKVPWVRIVK